MLVSIRPMITGGSWRNASSARPCCSSASKSWSGTIVPTAYTRERGAAVVSRSRLASAAPPSTAIGSRACPAAPASPATCPGCPFATCRVWQGMVRCYAWPMLLPLQLHTLLHICKSDIHSSRACGQRAAQSLICMTWADHASIEAHCGQLAALMWSSHDHKPDTEVVQSTPRPIP